MSKTKTIVSTIVLVLAALVGVAGPASATGAGSATPLAAYCDGAHVSPDLHRAWVRCYGFKEKKYRVMVQACSGAGRCDIRYGPWRNMDSGTWSERSDSYVWYTNAGYQLGN